MASESQSRSLVLLETSSRGIILYDSGRTVDKVLSRAGYYIGKKMDSIAKRRGWGPTIAIERIQIILGEENAREQMVKEMYSFWKDNHDACPKLSNLQKECLNLIKYTLPSESLSTQLTAFKGVVSLTTHYPYLRKFFHGFKSLKNHEDKEKAPLDLWKRSGNLDDQEWVFFSRMAAYCLSDEEVMKMVESMPPNEMGFISDKDGGLIENLRRVINCYAHYEAPCAVATRYLGGILESSHFWKEIGGVPHQYVLQGLFIATMHLAKAIGIECKVPVDPKVEIFSDSEGVDILSHAILVGVNIWLNLDPTRQVEAQYWHTDFKAFFRLVILENAQRLLPRSRSLAIQDYAWLIRYKEGLGTTEQEIQTPVEVTQQLDLNHSTQIPTKAFSPSVVSATDPHPHNPDIHPSAGVTRFPEFGLRIPKLPAPLFNSPFYIRASLANHSNGVLGSIDFGVSNMHQALAALTVDEASRPATSPAAHQIRILHPQLDQPIYIQSRPRSSVVTVYDLLAGIHAHFWSDFTGLNTLGALRRHEIIITAQERCRIMHILNDTVKYIDMLDGATVLTGLVQDIAPARELLRSGIDDVDGLRAVTFTFLSRTAHPTS